MLINTKSMTYAEKLKDPRWQKKRLEILNRDKWACQLCGDKETTLQVHHKSYNGDPWDSDSKDMVTYCEHCHLVIENLKKNELAQIIALKAFKRTGPGFVLIYAICSPSPEKFLVIIFSHSTITKEIVLVSHIDPKTFELVNKELKRQIKRK